MGGDLIKRFTSLGMAAALLLGGAIELTPARAAEVRESTCTDMSRDCLIEIARTYLDARYDGRMRPYQRVAVDVQRWENGIKTADSFDDILGPVEGEVSNTLRARNLDRAMVEGDQAVFFWILDMKDAPDQPWTSTVHLFERFKFDPSPTVCGDVLAPCITEIEVIFCISPRAGEDATPPGASDPNWFDSYRCRRDG